MEQNMAAIPFNSSYLSIFAAMANGPKMAKSSISFHSQRGSLVYGVGGALALTLPMGNLVNLAGNKK
jgi:hypothetical protein